MAGLEGPNKPEKDLKINVVRHGPSTYRQPEWTDVNTADDINTLGRFHDGSKTPEEIAEGKEKAIAIVRASAEEIAEDINPDEEVAIWSSPTGRTLETARIISEVLQKKGIQLRKKGTASEHGIKVFERLGEVENFSWLLFEPLMNGGEMEFQGKKFSIDKSLTNPKGMGYPDYFTTDAIKDIPDEVKQQWPKEYVDQIESFESFADVSERMASTLRKLKNLNDNHYRVILVSHDAMTGAMVKTFTSDQLGGINPGQFLTIERQDSNLVVTRVGDITEGDSNTDIAASIDKSE
jgi:broad specificity phosphatase PhoE